MAAMPPMGVRVGGGDGVFMGKVLAVIGCLGKALDRILA
jgi:hypothetical protein